MNNNNYSHYGLIDNSSNNRYAQNYSKPGRMGLELKSVVMINNFIIDHSNQQVIKQEAVNTPGHNRSTSMGNQNYGKSYFFKIITKGSANLH